MLSKPVAAWIIFSGFFLAAIAGSINAVGFLGVHHQALAHMSGPLTILSNELARSQPSLAFNAFLVVAAFFAGCGLSAAVIGQETLKLGRRYGAILMLESVALTLAWWFLLHQLYGGEYLAAFACGLQNAMASTYSGAIIRTTHMTGIVTDLGIALGHLIRRKSIDRRRTGLYSILLSGFCLGGIGGSYGYIKLGFDTLLVPAFITGAVGLIYTSFEHFRKRLPHTVETLT